MSTGLPPGPWKKHNSRHNDPSAASVIYDSRGIKVMSASHAMDYDMQGQSDYMTAEPAVWRAVELVPEMASLLRTWGAIECKEEQDMWNRERLALLAKLDATESTQ
jgi:hypothetical protein